MKKILSMVLVAAMLLSMLVFVAAIPAAAVNGAWDTYGLASESGENYDGEKKSVAGYKYDSEGFHMLTADWSSSTPFSQMSTKEKVNLKDGVYMQVRIDDYSYDASDKWFNFFLWSTPHIDEGAVGFGNGIQTLIRPGTSTDPEVPGALGGITWYFNEWTSAGGTTIDEANRAPVDGKNVLTLVVTYDPSTGYNVTINGCAAPEKIITYMNEAYATDSYAHVGFAMLSSKKGGSQAATILKFGTSEDTATVPTGDDSKDSVTHTVEYADPMDPTKIAEGEPAVLMTGNMAQSHLGNTPKSAVGTKITVTDKDTVAIVGNSATADAGIWKVDSDISYNIEDFPVVLCITKNFCSCGGEDECFSFETANVYVCAGENVTPAPNNHCKNIDICYNAYNIDGDNYLYFFYDTSLDEGKFSGRIHSTRFDFAIDTTTPGANEFEVVLQAFFRTEEDAEAWAEQYLIGLGWSDGEGEGDDTEDVTPDDSESVTPDDSETVTPDASETVTPDNPDDEETTTKAPEKTEAESEKEEAEGGCASAVGFGAIVIVAIATAAGFVTFKKKD